MPSWTTSKSRRRRTNRLHCIGADTLTEVAADLAGPPQSSDYFDQTLGRGNWRPFPGHVTYQHGKFRSIDDGLRVAVELSETVCVPDERVYRAGYSLAAQHIAAPRFLPNNATSWPRWPDWVQLVVGVEDMWNGLRQHHLSPSDEPLCIGIYATPTGEKVHHQLLGLPLALVLWSINSIVPRCCSPRSFAECCVLAPHTTLTKTPPSSSMSW